MKVFVRSYIFRDSFLDSIVAFSSFSLEDAKLLKPPG